MQQKESYFFTPPQTPNDPKRFAHDLASPAPLPDRPYENTVVGGVAQAPGGQAVPTVQYAAPGPPPAPQQPGDQYEQINPPPQGVQNVNLNHLANPNVQQVQLQQHGKPPLKSSESVGRSDDGTTNSKIDTSEADNKQNTTKSRRRLRKNKKIEESAEHPLIMASLVSNDYVKYHKKHDNAIKICLWIYLAYILIVGLGLIAFFLSFTMTYCFGKCGGFKEVDVLPFSRF
uniref:LITAF domain-containing protein n=1 Tax=Panagrellus redivivus TaxID=6233 RepID=A0A7E4VEA6_PANRE